MTDEKFKDFMCNDQNSKEVEDIFYELKKNFYEVKPGYDHAIIMKNTQNNKTWISSTNNIEQRMTTLERILEERDRKSWREPWQICFGNLGDDIKKHVEFKTDDIGKIPNKKFIDFVIPKNQVENAKELLIKLASEFTKSNNIKNVLEIRKIIDDHFNSDQKQQPLRDVIKLIDNLILEAIQ